MRLENHRRHNQRPDDSGSAWPERTSVGGRHGELSGSELPIPPSAAGCPLESGVRWRLRMLATVDPIDWRAVFLQWPGRPAIPIWGGL